MDEWKGSVSQCPELIAKIRCWDGNGGVCSNSGCSVWSIGVLHSSGNGAGGALLLPAGTPFFVYRGGIFLGSEASVRLIAIYDCIWGIKEGCRIVEGMKAAGLL